MRVSYFAIGAVALLAVGCAQKPKTEPGFERIADEAMFQERIAGRTLSIEGDQVRIEGDGTWAGEWDGTVIFGTWYFTDDGYWCREGMRGDEPMALDCQVWTIKDDQVRVTRKRGNGRSFTYTVTQ